MVCCNKSSRSCRRRKPGISCKLIIIWQLVIVINLRAFFRYHMKRCVDSGLWVPSSEDPGTSTEDGFVKAPVEDEEEEEVYDEVK